MIVCSTGWTYQELRLTPWPDIVELMAYMGKQRPTHILVHQYLVAQGMLKESDYNEEADLASEDDIASIMAMGRNQ